MKNKRFHFFAYPYLVGVVACFLFGLTACTLEQTEPLKTPTVTQVNTPTSTATPTAQKRNTPAATTMTATARPSLTATIVPSVTPSPTATPASPFSDLPVEQRCSSQPVQVNTGTEAATGLILFGDWGDWRGDAILGSDGLGSPIFFLPTGAFLLDTSPDQKSFAFFSERSGSLNTLDFTLIDAATTQPITEIRFEDLALLFSVRIGAWINDEQLVINLANEGELYRWLVWSPFQDEQETLEVELAGIGDALERYHTAISYDPFLEFVIYPCQDCPPAEYVVKDMHTGETRWTIDLGPNPSLAYRGFPAWSPDGQYVAIVGGDYPKERVLWIFNRQGDELYRIQDSGLRLSWSPNGRYLALGRDNQSPDNSTRYSTTLLDLVENKIIDLCIYTDPQDLPRYWSWDSRKIAFAPNVSHMNDPNTLIHIVDIASGDIVQLAGEGVNYRIEGWVNTGLGEP